MTEKEKVTLFLFMCDLYCKTQETVQQEAHLQNSECLLEAPF